MEKILVMIITAAYSAGGIATFVGFVPTMRDLILKKPSANISTYVVWSLTTFFTALYAMFVVKDLVFAVVINLQLLACATVLGLRIRLKLKFGI